MSDEAALRRRFLLATASAAGALASRAFDVVSSASLSATAADDTASVLLELDAADTGNASEVMKGREAEGEDE